MAVYSETFELRTQSEGQAIDITERVAAAISRSNVRAGIACVFTPSSTSAIVANEHESGLMEDLRALLSRIAPAGAGYAHDAAWGDANGHSHLRAMVLGPSATVPVHAGKPAMGPWQQLLFLELDVRPRERTVRVDVVGE